MIVRKVATITDICNNKSKKEVFIKYSPLIDPVKYMIGKYENNYNILELPKFIDTNNLDAKSMEYMKNYKKILDPNNSAYIDGFFSYLSSCLLNNFNFNEMILSPNEHHSINEIVQILESIVLKDIHQYNYDKSKPNGQKQKNTNNMKFRSFCEKFNFELTPLRNGLEQTINYFINTFENNPKALKL